MIPYAGVHLALPVALTPYIGVRCLPFEPGELPRPPEDSLQDDDAAEMGADAEAHVVVDAEAQAVDTEA